VWERRRQEDRGSGSGHRLLAVVQKQPENDFKREHRFRTFR